MSAFSKEVQTQPSALVDMIRVYQNQEYRPLVQAAKAVSSAEALVFCGMGSSFYAPLCCMDGLAGVTRVSRLEAGQVLGHALHYIKPGDVAVLISQSGESIEIQHLCRAFGGKRQIIGITNNQASTLGRQADILLPLYAGEEESITNRTFTNTLALLYWLGGICIGKNPGETASELMEAAKSMGAVLTQGGLLRRMAEYVGDTGILHFLGQDGAEMALAEQAALVFMEGAGCNARAFSCGAFRHGPIEISSPRHRAVFFSFSLATHQAMLRLARQLRKHGGRVAFITNQPHEEAFCLPIAAQGQQACLLAASVAMELLLMETAALHGLVAGDFQITHKICVQE